MAPNIVAPGIVAPGIVAPGIVAPGIVAPGILSIEPRPARLSGIEAIRAVAACAVVCYHVARHMTKNYDLPWLMRPFQFGHAGVDLFFVVSGFIILHVHHDDIGRPARIRRYLTRRCRRVLPMYWIASGLTVLISVAAGHGWPPLQRLLWSITLLPASDEPILGVAWTLQFEVMFYAAFCLLILSRRLGQAVMALWLSLVVARLLWPGAAGIPAFPGDSYNLEFFLGMAAAWWLRRGRQIPVLGAGIVLFAVVALAEDLGRFNGYAAPARLAYGTASLLLVLGVAQRERSVGLAVPGWLAALGGASYSIYLFQFIGIGIAWKLWLAAGLGGLPGWTSFPLLCLAAIVGGVAVSRLIERPLLRWATPRPAIVEIGGPVAAEPKVHFRPGVLHKGLDPENGVVPEA